MRKAKWAVITFIVLLAAIFVSPVQAESLDSLAEGTYTAGNEIPAGLNTFKIENGIAKIYVKRDGADLAGEAIDSSGQAAPNKFTAGLRTGDTVQVALDAGASNVKVSAGEIDSANVSQGFYEIGKDLAEGTFVLRHADGSAHITILDSNFAESDSFSIDKENGLRDYTFTEGSFLYISGGSLSIIQKELVPDRIQLSRTTLSIEKGKTAKLTATVFPATAVNRDVSWHSSNQEVATVDANGKITAIKPGKSVITVISKGESTVKESATVTVTNILPTSLKLSKTALDIAINQTVRVTPVVGPTNAGNKTVLWESSDRKIATVDAKGNIKGIAKGSAIITATTKDNPKVYKELTVKVSPKTVKVNKTSLSLMTGKTAKLSATVLPKDSTDKAVKWKSSNTKLATVDSKGKVVAKAKGKVTITASAKGAKSASVKVTVTSPIVAKTIKLNKTSATLKKGKTLTLKATIGPSNTTNKTVKWKSSNTKVATVSSKGVVTAKGAGTAKITATTSNGKSVSATITVPYIKSLTTGKWKVGRDIPAGRYRITTNDEMGNLFITTKSYDRDVNEVLTDGEQDFGVSVVTTDIKNGDIIEILDLESVQFQKVAHKKSNTLHSGYWTVGKDISPGRYRVSTTDDSGNLFVSRGDYLIINEILGNNSDGFGVSSITTTLKTGDKIAIAGMDTVRFTKK
ncbi:Ig-like domain-containing protein [Aciduricibacillus chroicocephali]|uniref:Ig-like domain-containing protein n=1 Tax=Aciduricibacillus chroicocephali TaxID=3054939 RepID=A0ABY9KY13_9BACI|nr:Ig-like domain-containing protein [Bacillaceae bacterium 44XB]